MPKLHLSENDAKKRSTMQPHAGVGLRLGLSGVTAFWVLVMVGPNIPPTFLAR